MTRSAATKADKARRDRLRELLNRGCACHLNPPCDLCSGLDKDEWDIFENDGTDALLNLFDSLDEELESADRPMAWAEEQAAAALAAAEQRGADRERAAIVAYLRRNPGVSRAPECITAMTPFECAATIAAGRHLRGGQ